MQVGSSGEDVVPERIISLPSVMRIYTDGMGVHAGTKSHMGVYSVWIENNHPANNSWWSKEGEITNQSMELAGVNAGLNAILRMKNNLSKTRNIVYSTSHYVMNCMTKWLPRWERTGWITKQKRVVHNRAILKNMADIAREHNVEFVRVPPELLNDEAVGPNSIDQVIIDGMKNARKALMDAANEGSQTGCVKKRGGVTCEWMGG